MAKFNIMDFKPNLKNILWKAGFKNLPDAYIRLKVPGVTSIINDMIPDPGIDEWIKKVGKKVSDAITQAAHYRGKAMHIFIENFLIEMKKSGDPSKSLKFTQIESPKFLLNEENIPKYKIEEGRKLFYNFYDSEYINQYSKLLGTETMVYSPVLFFRGKIDWFYTQKLYGLSISDFKTASNLIKKGSIKELKYFYQIGAYALGMDHLLEKNERNEKINYASIINMHTKSNRIQNIELFGKKLQEYKDKFKTIAEKWHKNNGQGFLTEGL